MKKIKVKKSKVKDIWSIIHQAVATDRRLFTETHVEAETAEKALSFFNKKIADEHWIYKAKIENVRQFEVYKAE